MQRPNRHVQECVIWILQMELQMLATEAASTTETLIPPRTHMHHIPKRGKIDKIGMLVHKA